MNLLQEYKELYYKEIEFSDRLNNKITTCITFLTILGSALILLWTQIKNYELLWYTGIYLMFCMVTTIMFFICIAMFFITYSGYKTQLFPIKTIAIQNTNVLNTVSSNQLEDANKLLEQKMSERFINDAIHNRQLNIIKNNRHRNLIKMIMATFIITFITFSINVSIDYYETNYINKILIMEVKRMSNDDVIKMNTDIKLTDSNGNPIPVNTPQPEYLTETFSWNKITQNEIPSSKIFTGEE